MHFLSQWNEHICLIRKEKRQYQDQLGEGLFVLFWLRFFFKENPFVLMCFGDANGNYYIEERKKGNERKDRH